MSGPADIPAGDFGDWLAHMRDVLAGRAEADVACDGCTACCDTSHFVHIEPDEHAALAAFPRPLHAPAPGRPRGHVVIGFDAAGRCPMLGAGACTIHASRPRTCRRYDCRVFAAAGIDADRAAITARARRWAFAYASPADRARHDAVRACARFVRERAACFPGGAAPGDPPAIAVLAIETHEVFLGRAWDPATSGADEDEAIAHAIVAASRRADAPAPAGGPVSTHAIRIAREQDRATIDAIYAHYVRTSTCTYAEEPDSDEVRRAWFEAHGPRHPITVIEMDGAVVGWGSLSPWKDRSAYRNTVELSVYLAPEWCGRGLGRELLADLIARATALGYHALIGGISADQTASVRLHERMGFTRVAHFRETGFKFGRWLDVVYYELLLGEPRA